MQDSVVYLAWHEWFASGNMKSLEMIGSNFWVPFCLLREPDGVLRRSAAIWSVAFVSPIILCFCSRSEFKNSTSCLWPAFVFLLCTRFTLRNTAIISCCDDVTIKSLEWYVYHVIQNYKSKLTICEGFVCSINYVVKSNWAFNRASQFESIWPAGWMVILRMGK